MLFFVVQCTRSIYHLFGRIVRPPYVRVLKSRSVLFHMRLPCHEFFLLYFNSNLRAAHSAAKVAWHPSGVVRYPSV